jgi:hypothetical protein
MRAVLHRVARPLEPAMIPGLRGFADFDRFQASKSAISGRGGEK